ncbi:GNAT family N-acetyltransferase [Balneolaceae bacterium ANBcel3]|nr:GNAT family N-acetyltransferase [Balneolaceae bacterium ANBcel3]
MNTTCSYATQKHFLWLKDRDRWLSEEALKNKVSSNEVLLAQDGKIIVGWLRFGYFWDIIPIMNMLFIDEAYRGKGTGKALVQFWEDEMKKKGHTLVLTSSPSNEDAQHFYRKIGFTDAGSFTLPNEPVEQIFTKQL